MSTTSIKALRNRYAKLLYGNAKFIDIKQAKEKLMMAELAIKNINPIQQ